MNDCSCVICDKCKEHIGKVDGEYKYHVVAGETFCDGCFKKELDKDFFNMRLRKNEA